MRRGTLIAVIVLFVLIGVAAFFQYLAAQKHVRYPGPARGTPFPPTATLPSP